MYWMLRLYRTLGSYEMMIFYVRIIELVTPTFSISKIFAPIKCKISKKGILISKNPKILLI